MVTLSQLRKVTGEELANAAIHWDRAADAHESVYGVVHAETLGLNRTGATQDASVDRIATDYSTVKANSQSLSNAASIARNQASVLATMAGEVYHLADEAIENQFLIDDETLEATDNKRGTSLQEFIKRDGQAEEYTSQLQARAANYVTHRQQVATDMIQAVDNTVCDDPDYIPNMLRRIGGKIAGGILVGGATGFTGGAGVGVVPGMIGGALGGTLWGVLGEVEGDGPKCK